ncbi:hybrid sensor histidine kinase/response regulator [Anabaena sp. UHCC 0187]|uniref:hybrid sensor histidine kinase/response regulator n=1 Tax=Anabaena sp. UHCC 0187 TaxID=2590018 RepID=UPI0014457735|nr:hybrid sensor histidine kinase/response regulator [Anabaena sp. UHCC 0187]MDP5016318.1 hybrid sensor histidine kinase/response regulator [Dolichospermum sp.]MTJ14388.1 hybrid sensor histidine kinase/response regulator [Anabaena sp. UHCC 0187]
MKKLNSVLVVDDEPDNFDVIEALLINEKYELNYASNGSKALERMNMIQPDLILLDVMMPELNGIEVCQIIKANLKWQHIPIIMVTALNSKEDLAMCLAAGADDFVSKPVNKTELQARIRSMLRLKQQYDALEELTKLREDMVNMIVHDLRNPLANILLCAEILQLPNIPHTAYQPKLEQIVFGVQQLQSMIDTLLWTAKLESGQMTLNRQDVDLYYVCISVLKDFQLLTTQKNIQLIGDLPEPGHFVSLDIAVFRRVLDNLISNALKFSPNNSQVMLRVYYPTSAQVVIQVSDAGIGVPEQLKQTIFDKYAVGNPVQGVSQTGLGLAFCKMVIDAHGGTIFIEDNQPTGSIFTINMQTSTN